MRTVLVLAALVVVGLATPPAQAAPQPDVVISSVNASSVRQTAFFTGTVTVTNIGNAAATGVVGQAHNLPGQNGILVVSGPTNGASIFLITNGVGASLATLNPGASFSFNFQFEMRAAGTGPFVIDVSSTSPQPTGNDSVTQPITVTGLDMTTAPAFPDTELGLIGPPQRVTLTNRTAVSVTPGALALTGDAADDFLLLPTSDTCTAALVPDATCSFTLRFAPSALGARAATLSVPTSNPLVHPDYALTANGIARQVNTGPPGPPGPSGADGKPAFKLVLAAASTAVRARAGRSVRLAYAATVAGPVRLDVVKGTKTVAQVQKTAKVGANTVTWNGRAAGRKAAPGRYTLRLSAQNGSQTATAQARLTLTR